MRELFAIQQDLKAPKNQFNKFGNYKYRNLEDILEAVKPLLLKEKCVLVISDELVNIGTKNYVKAIAKLYKSDGTLIAENATYAREAESQKGMNDSQLTGSTSSYARKYALNGLFAIDDTKDSDATNTHGENPPQPQQSKKTTKRINYTEVAKTFNTVEALGEWYKGLSPQQQTESAGVVKNRKEELLNSESRFTKLINEAKTLQDFNDIEELMKGKEIENFAELANLFNKRALGLGIETSIIPF